MPPPANSTALLVRSASASVNLKNTMGLVVPLQKATSWTSGTPPPPPPPSLASVAAQKQHLLSPTPFSRDRALSDPTSMSRDNR